MIAAGSAGPSSARLQIRYRGSFDYIDGVTTEDTLEFCRLRYLSFPTRVGLRHLPSQQGR